MFFYNLCLLDNLLYSVPYHHFTNSIENYFSMMKSRLYKLDGLTLTNLMTNIKKLRKYQKKSMKILLKEHINAQKNMLKKYLIEYVN